MHLLVACYVPCKEEDHVVIKKLITERAPLYDELTKYMGRFRKLTTESKPKTLVNQKTDR
jgi:hypothetical protein